MLDMGIKVRAKIIFEYFVKFQRVAWEIDKFFQGKFYFDF